MTINLHSIFCHLTNDDDFLSTIIETDDIEIDKKKDKKKGFNLMDNMITEYVPLSPYNTQKYSLFPNNVKSYLTPDYIRFGIKNVIEKNLNIINISFMNSLNMLLRPDIYKLSIDEHIRNLNALEEFICQKIKRNFQIDKTKNTKKVQAANRDLIKNLSEGKISHDLIQIIINIFEINLLVFDLTKMDIYFYWTKGHKYPFLNLFKNMHCMSYVQGNYEPIMSINNITNEQKQKIYTHILANIIKIKCIPDVKLAIHTLLYIESWNIDSESFIKIIDTFYKKPFKGILKLHDDIIEKKLECH